jgi:hypothetical protein
MKSAECRIEEGRISADCGMRRVTIIGSVGVMKV